MPDRCIGQVIENRYEVQALIGEGGMANVYRGRDMAENKTVALKILRSEMRGNEELIRRFTNESRAISVLNHNNIVKVYDVGVLPDLQYIVMEYIDGITLKQYLEQRGAALPSKECLHFLIQVLQALQHAHDKGIVHRDIKPQNIMLMRDGTLKVMDFGIARLARSEIHTATNQAIGSVHYISPEQAQGEATDARADIYSVGIMMYEMLTGRLPFDSENAVAVAMKQIQEAAVPIKDINPEVPVGLQEIAEKAMAKEPEVRYQGALDMLRDVQAFRQNPEIRFDYETAKDDAFLQEEKMNNNSKPKTTTAQRRPGAAAGRKGKKKTDLLMPIAAGVTAAIMLVCVFLSLNIFRESGNPLFGDVPVLELPNVTGLAEADAVAALMGAGILEKNIIVNTRVDEELSPGTVISQNPAPREVKQTQKVTIVVSVGQTQTVVPDIAGKTRSEGQAIVIEEGLSPYIKILYDNAKPAGTIDSTQPAAGTPVYTGDTVIIYVYAQKMTTETEVPDLIGLASQAEAKKKLTEASLQLSSTVEEEFHPTAPAGSIIKQYPKAGEKVSLFTAVKIVVSTGPEPEAPKTAKVPDLTGKTFEEAKRILQDLGFTVTEESVAGNVANMGKVVGQSIPANADAVVGTGIVLKVVRTDEAANPLPPSSSSSSP